MKEKLTIAKNPKLHPSMDYDFLRREGLKHIEALAHDLWTDYNSHDPGISILEVLCYAITELGYRSNFDMKDLLTDAEGQAFFSAREILTVSPWNISDYRKLLLDIPGVNNAWLFTDGKQETPIYADCEEDQLSHEVTPQEIKLSGLYEVLIDLAIDLDLGDLNTGDILLENIAFALKPMVDIEAGEFMLKFDLPSIKESSHQVIWNTPETAIVENVPNQNWRFILKLTWEDGNAIDVPLRVSIPKHPAKGRVTLDHVTLILQVADYVQLLIETYQTKLQKADGIMKQVIKNLHEHRNLCEDFTHIAPIDSEEIAFCFDVDVSPATDIEKVQAEIYFAIEHYLNPPVSFFTLKELMEQGKPVEEIFEGPKLHHGFIDTEELEKAQLRTIVYASDIINLLMDIPGVEAVRNFMMTKYDQEGRVVPSAKNQSWCMPVSHMHKPVLSKDHSKILFFKDSIPFLSNYEEVKDTVALMHAQRTRTKMAGLPLDLSMPKGRKRDTLSHWPAQYDLPMTYGVGEFGLPSNATIERIAQQQQLKAYMMFFEQLLADYFSQLSHAKDLLSVLPIRQTYFAQYLEEIKDIAPVLHEDLEKAIANDPGSITSTELWQKLYESKKDFYQRRNGFLDHLLARFAESFNEYALLMYRINFENLTEEKIGPEEAIEIKIETIKSYPEISYGRGKAFNYFPQNEDFNLNPEKLWDTKNVSGLEKRISRLTGIKDFSRRFLYCIQNIEIICDETEVGDEVHCRHHFHLTTRNGIRLESKQFEQKEEAEETLIKVLELGLDAENYHYTTRKVKLKEQNQILLESKQTFANEDLADEVIAEIVAELNSPCNDPEGLHLVEHLLLRPRAGDFELMEVCLDDCNCFCDLDPYSFRVSIILPHWPGHFDNMAFREYFEKRVREEAPAHIQVKVCWVGNEQLRMFETTYQSWLNALAAMQIDADQADEFRQANDELIKIMAKLKSIYPKATLHDCVESDADQNPVRLGKTILGTQKQL